MTEWATLPYIVLCPNMKFDNLRNKLHLWTYYYLRSSLVHLIEYVIFYIDYIYMQAESRFSDFSAPYERLVISGMYSNLEVPCEWNRTQDCFQGSLTPDINSLLKPTSIRRTVCTVGTWMCECERGLRLLGGLFVFVFLVSIFNFIFIFIIFAW